MTPSSRFLFGAANAIEPWWSSESHRKGTHTGYGSECIGCRQSDGDMGSYMVPEFHQLPFSKQSLNTQSLRIASTEESRVFVIIVKRWRGRGGGDGDDPGLFLPWRIKSFRTDSDSELQANPFVLICLLTCGLTMQGDLASNSRPSSFGFPSTRITAHPASVTQ